MLDLRMYHSSRFTSRSILLLVLLGLYICESTRAQTSNQLVRLAVIEVDTSQLQAYNHLLKEEIEASIRIEPGVLTLFAITEKENPGHITIFETYVDSSQYKAHLATPHFLKYKNGTKDMVKHLQLIETKPIFYNRKSKLSQELSENFFIRLIKIEIDSNEIGNFSRLARQVMAPGIEKEPGVVVMYAVSEKKSPTQISVLEVYASAFAYETHLKTPHFRKYKEESKLMIKSSKVVDVKPVSLGAKP